MRKFLMKRLDSHKDNYRNVPIVMPPEEDDASIRIAQRRKRRGDYDGVDDRGPRKRGRKPKKEQKEEQGCNSIDILGISPKLSLIMLKVLKHV